MILSNQGYWKASYMFSKIEILFRLASKLYHVDEFFGASCFCAPLCSRCAGLETAIPSFRISFVRGIRCYEKLFAFLIFLNLDDIDESNSSFIVRDVVTRNYPNGRSTASSRSGSK